MPHQKQLLVLFDGHALIHRAFHALPSLTLRRTGEPTGAVFGFASMILKVVGDLKPTHWAIAFDTPVPTFRHERFEDYKAHRPPTPQELKSQIGRVRELVQAFNLPYFEVDGYEADDVIGTISRLTSEKGLDTVIVTGDTDTFQLVSPHVSVLTPRPGKPFSDTIVYDEETVKQRYGLSPQQLVDLKGLKGDPSDNIPGVPGIGEKTATKLIQQFGSIERIYESIDQVEPERVRTLLRDAEDKARESQTLVKIVTDVPIDFDPDCCRVGAFQRDKVAELFRELEFGSLLLKLPASILGEEEALPTEARPEAEPNEYEVVDTADALERVVHRDHRA